MEKREQEAAGSTGTALAEEPGGIDSPDTPRRGQGPLAPTFERRSPGPHHVLIDIL